MSDSHDDVQIPYSRTRKIELGFDVIILYIIRQGKHIESQSLKPSRLRNTNIKSFEVRNERV